MAYRPKGFGLTGEVNRKIANKYDVQLEIEARAWIEDILQESISTDETKDMPPGPDRLHKELKNGIVLCRLINTIKPGMIKKINDTKLAFKQMENIGNFLSSCEQLCIKATDMFQTADLYEKVNMFQVLNGIHALGRKAQKVGYVGPILGVKESDSNPRSFTEDQMNAGQRVIGLQMGSNQGATQQGMSFGTTRGIL